MIPRVSRGPGYYTASHWFQGAVLLVVIGSLAIGILSALSDARDRAERQMVELMVRNLRTGMQLAMGEALMHQRDREIISWVGRNPIAWLGASPAGYLGVCAASGRQELPGGAWCFDGERRELVYRPRRSDQLRALPGSPDQQCRDLSWRVARAPESVASGGFVGLRLEAATPCQWISEGS